MVTAKLEATRKILSLIDQQVDGLAIHSSEKNILSGGLYDISLEHGKSIVVLFEQSLFGSGYALIRPMFESFIRAAWLNHCATDQQVSSVVTKDKYPLNLGQLLEDLESVHYESNTLSRIKQDVYNNLNSYTHGGVQLIFRRFSNDAIIHRADGDEISGILKHILLISFLSFCGIADLAKDSDAYIDSIYDIKESVFENLNQ